MRFDPKWLHRLTTSLPAPTGKLPVPNKTAAVTTAAIAAGAALWWLASAPPAPAPTPPSPPAETPQPAQAQPLSPTDPPQPPSFTSDPSTWPRLPETLQPILTSESATALLEPAATLEADGQAEPAAPDSEEPQPRVQPWIVLDNARYPLNLDVVDHYNALPRPYTWPLPDFDQLELICYDNPEHPYLGILQTPDGRLFNWGKERRFLTEDLERDQVDTTEVATIAFPGAFLEPLRAAAHAVCAQAHDDRQADANN
ncbi:MAG: hypothetical protein OXI15_02355 [Chromatiales bacterium]|nr:hypothetical protein [Chromatiales bacterium]